MSAASVAVRSSFLVSALVALLLSHAAAQSPAAASSSAAPSPAAAQSPAPEGPPQWSQARIESRTYHFKEAGKEMEYALFVPARYEKGTTTPLLVALHGLYSTPKQILWYPGLTDLAEKYGWIVVAPMGYDRCGWYGARPLVKPDPSEPENLCELSEKDVMNVLEIVRREYTVDPDRTYLMGHSMGGGGVWHLAIKYPRLWAGLAPIAPATLRSPSDLEKIRHLPVILVQGEKDRLVPARKVRPWAEKMKQLGMTCEYIEIPGGDHVMSAFEGLPKIFEFLDRQKRTAKGN